MMNALGVDSKRESISGPADDDDAGAAAAADEAAERARDLAARMSRSASITDARRDEKGHVVQCGGCSRIIATTEDSLVALGKTWHDGCFKCGGCGAPFGPTESFADGGGVPYHMSCLVEKQASACKRCGVKLTGAFIKAGGDAYHEGCFVCATCGGSLDGGYLPRKLDGQPVCSAGCSKGGA